MAGSMNCRMHCIQCTVCRLGDAGYVTLPSGVLQISSLAESDTGLYRCIASRGELHNLPDEIDDIEMMRSKEARLKIHTVGRNRRLRVLGSSQNVAVRQGETAILECLVDGRPLPNITWYRFDKKAIRTDYAVQFGQGNLKIFDAQSSDSGTYVCSANVPTGSGFKELKSYSNLTVHVPPSLKSNFNSQRWPFDRIVIFTCNVDGNPRPNVTWFFNGKQLRSNSRSKFQLKSKHTLNIINAGLKQSGYYQCMATNDAGQFIATARLEIFTRDGVPPAPLIKEAKSTSPTTIFLRWEQPTTNPEKPILTTAIYYTKNDGKIQTMFAQQNNYTLTALEPYTNYTIEVRSYNSIGASVSDRHTVVQTQEGVPESVPTLTVRSLSSRSIGVEWEALSASDSRGEIIQHRIYYHEDGQADIKMYEVPGSQFSFTIQDLEPGTVYQVIVLAGTKVGFPDVKDERWKWVTHKTPVSDVLPAPRLQIRFVNATCVILTWSIEGDASNIRSYDIVLRNLKNGDDVIRDVHIVSPALKHVLCGLENDSTYEITIHANGIGSQKFGTVTEEFRTTDKAIYPVPQNLSAEVLDLSSRVKITWEYTGLLGSAVSFTVCYRLDNYRVDDGRQCRNSNKKSITIENLEQNKRYRFVVVATVDGHKSQESEPYLFVVTYNNKVPSAPTNITYRLLSAEAIELQWKPPKSPNGKITSYIIFYVSNDTKQHLWRNFTKPGALTKSEVKELKAAAYYFKLQACNQVGEGDMSHVLLVRLDQKRTGASLFAKSTLAIVIGVSIGIVCIIICCIVVFVFRQRCLNQSEQCSHSPPTFHGNGHLPCNGNGHAHPTTNVELKEWEVTPMLTQMLENEQSDSKGGGNLIVTPNGVKVNGLLQGFQNGHLPNGHVTSLEGHGHLEGVANCEEHRGLIAAMLASTDGSQTGDGSESGVNISNISSLSPGVESLEDIDRSASEDEEDDNNSLRDIGVVRDSRRSYRDVDMRVIPGEPKSRGLVGRMDQFAPQEDDEETVNISADDGPCGSTGHHGDEASLLPSTTTMTSRPAPAMKAHQPTTSLSGSRLPPPTSCRTPGRNIDGEGSVGLSNRSPDDNSYHRPPPQSSTAKTSRAAVAKATTTTTTAAAAAATAASRSEPQGKKSKADSSSTGSSAIPQGDNVHSASPHSRLPQGNMARPAPVSSLASQELCKDFISTAARSDKATSRVTAAPTSAAATGKSSQEPADVSTMGSSSLPHPIPQFYRQTSTPSAFAGSEAVSIV
ncbi:protogenin B-like [Gigantopelta aegis]|uniref:protogenin B-like n=1 Tax=Gigantopelta aegis TaxID=1735272 RepID=UPI001B88ABD6|nr:protogenin B-like [Gigantopelta aegis]